MEAQSYSLTLEDRVSVEYITKHIASVQQVRSKHLTPGGDWMFDLHKCCVSHTSFFMLTPHVKLCMCSVTRRVEACGPSVSRH